MRNIIWIVLLAGCGDGALTYTPPQDDASAEVQAAAPAAGSAAAAGAAGTGDAGIDSMVSNAAEVSAGTITWCGPGYHRITVEYSLDVIWCAPIDPNTRPVVDNPCGSGRPYGYHEATGTYWCIGYAGVDARSS